MKARDRRAKKKEREEKKKVLKRCCKPTINYLRGIELASLFSFSLRKGSKWLIYFIIVEIAWKGKNVHKGAQTIVSPLWPGPDTLQVPDLFILEIIETLEGKEEQKKSNLSSQWRCNCFYLVDGSRATLNLLLHSSAPPLFLLLYTKYLPRRPSILCKHFLNTDG